MATKPNIIASLLQAYRETGNANFLARANKLQQTDKGDRIMKQTMESALDGNLKLEKETLSDGSHVYNVLIGSYEIGCINRAVAIALFSSIVRLLKNKPWRIIK
jgi:hypothetical protein